MLDATVLRRLSQTSPIWSLLTLGAIYAAAVALGAASWALGSWSVPLAVLAIGTLQHALFLLYHDATHQGLHPNRRVNEWVGDWLVGIPLFSRLSHYRCFHLRHHRFVRTPDDPEFRSLLAIMEPTALRGVLAAVSGLTGLKGALSQLRFNRWARRRGLITSRWWVDLGVLLGAWGAAVGAAALLGGGEGVLAFFLYWALPLGVVWPFLLKLHSYADHPVDGTVGPTEFDRTLSRRFSGLSEWVFNPLQSGEHLAHHLYPSVPWYRLRRLRAALEASPEFREGVMRWESDGYFFGRSTVWARVLRNNPRGVL